MHKRETYTVMTLVKTDLRRPYENTRFTYNLSVRAVFTFKGLQLQEDFCNMNIKKEQRKEK